MPNSAKELRQIGISSSQFELLLSELQKEIEKDLNKNPKKRVVLLVKISLQETNYY